MSCTSNHRLGANWIRDAITYGLIRKSIAVNIFELIILIHHSPISLTIERPTLFPFPSLYH